MPISIIAHQTAHYIPILLLYIATVILLVGARPGKGEFLLMTIGVEALVDEFTAIVRVHTKQSEGEALPHPMHCGAYSLLAFTPDWETFRPAAGHIYSAKRVQVKAFRTLSAVSYQVCFHKARLILLPVGKDPDRYRVLK